MFENQFPCSPLSVLCIMQVDWGR